MEAHGRPDYGLAPARMAGRDHPPLLDHGRPTMAVAAAADLVLTKAIPQAEPPERRERAAVINRTPAPQPWEPRPARNRRLQGERPAA
jgi:hypothetical protein